MNRERGQGTNSDFGCLHWNPLIHAWISGDWSSLVRAENFRTCADTLSRLRSPSRSSHPRWHLQRSTRHGLGHRDEYGLRFRMKMSRKLAKEMLPRLRQRSMRRGHDLPAGYSLNPIGKLVPCPLHLHFDRRELGLYPARQSSTVAA